MLLLFHNRLRHVDDDKVTLATWLVSVCMFLSTIHPFFFAGNKSLSASISGVMTVSEWCVCVEAWVIFMMIFLLRLLREERLSALSWGERDRGETEKNEKLHFFTFLFFFFIIFNMFRLYAASPPPFLIICFVLMRCQGLLLMCSSSHPITLIFFSLLLFLDRYLSQKGKMLLVCMQKKVEKSLKNSMLSLCWSSIVVVVVVVAVKDVWRCVMTEHRTQQWAEEKNSVE